MREQDNGRMASTSGAPVAMRSPLATAASAARAVAEAPFTRRAWSELGWCLAGFPLGVAGFAVTVVLLALGAGLSATVAGLILGVPLLVGALAACRGLGALHRRLAAALLGERVAAPPRARPGRGVLGRVGARLRDGASWRAVAYLLVKLPVGVLGLYPAALGVGGLVNMTYPLWWEGFRHHPPGTHLRPVPVLTLLPMGSFQVATFAGTFAAFVVGAAAVLVAPWLARAVVAADRRLVRGLLGPRALAERVRALEETRALAVDDAAATLRRLERDLHDGTQARLIALAMNLGLASEKLAGGGDGDVDGQPAAVARARELVDSAHQTTTEAIAELRDLARGIHPPVLDTGLADALATLAARSAVPVTLSVDIPRRPTAAIETIAYFCAAELLANVTRHSGARRVQVEAAGHGGVLRLRVSDDGRGGARLGTAAGAGAGSGLRGLAQRVRTVDGSLSVDSPPGGPTVVTVELPLHA
jgi:signal transduction histidine kinase